MYPFFEIIPGIFIYTFGLSLSICFFVFLFTIQRNAKRFGYDATFFTHNILWYFLGVFFFSRLFYIISQWQNMKFLKDPFQFFIMSDFNFSLFGAIFGFLCVYKLLIRVEKRNFDQYMDGAVISFFIILIIGYIGAFFGGQVYGRETNTGLEILYNMHDFTPVPFQVPIFPLPLVYAFFSFLLALGLYSLSLFVHIRGFIGYLGLTIFSSLVLIFEFFSGKEDIFSVSSAFNFPQLCALVLALWSMYQLYRVSREMNISDIARISLKHEE